MASEREISDAINVLLKAARTAFNEPNGHPANYRWSISGNSLECMHTTRRPLEWKTWPSAIRTNPATNNNNNKAGDA
jgi:hypothetical protein